MAVEKAKIIIIDGEKRIEMPIQFNPDTYTLTTTAKMANKKDVAGKEKSQPIEKSSETLSMKLIFDTLQDDISVRKKYTDRLVEMINSLKTTGSNINIPNCKFVWGNFIFCGYINSVTQNFTMFLPSGIPVRATVDITIQSDKGMNFEKEEQKETDNYVGDLFDENPNPRTK